VDAFSSAADEAARDIARWAAQTVCEADPEAEACR